MPSTATALILEQSRAKREIVGHRAGLRCVLDAVDAVAGTDSTVLIEGETGSGKELIAQAVHEGSLRKRGPYVKMNCAAIPAGLLESELFGHERGAFTGACSQRVGRFQQANGGTLFLDEIGDMPLELQPKLLRVLQEQEFEKLGSGGRTIRVDVRIVAATNQDLLQMVRERLFRADLYYRLNVFPIKVPPLRERHGDVRLLVEHFVQVFASKMDRGVLRIPEAILNILSRQEWPGNVRELKNVIERAVIISPGPDLQLASDEFRELRNARPAEIRTLAEAEREHILEVLRRTNWVVAGRSGAAAQLGLPRTTLLSRMQKLGIRRVGVQKVQD